MSLAHTDTMAAVLRDCKPFTRDYKIKVMESQEQLKKDPPVFERSVMLTRFKLSQQKRQLREKDNEPSKTQALKKSPKSSTKKQKQSPIKNKEKSQLNGEKNEFYPNKLKRNKIVNKIVLKPKNDLKVINWNDVKRKSIQMSPIVIRTNTLESMPDLASEYRRKQARKRKPQKIIIEKEECKTNKSIENFTK
ncbi:hypothetical protein RR48_01509 [Papilio machaon]|uniref:Uncharacterized protein n=1 Tax=Papilio machaon TaxID=76193 RepID=A0A0N1IQ94_PAPMA|nr:hypothetical protein RR48_01509 [Papilio machaon]